MRRWLRKSAGISHHVSAETVIHADQRAINPDSYQLAGNAINSRTKAGHIALTKVQENGQMFGEIAY